MDISFVHLKQGHSFPLQRLDITSVKVFRKYYAGCTFYVYWKYPIFELKVNKSSRTLFIWYSLCSEHLVSTCQAWLRTV